MVRRLMVMLAMVVLVGGCVEGLDKG